MQKRLAPTRALLVLSALALTASNAHAACPAGMTREQAEATPMVLVDLPTSAGTIHIGLMPGAAPETVAAFLENLDMGYYDNTMFHHSWPDGTENFNTAAFDGGFFKADGDDIQIIPTLSVSEADESCLENVRGAIVAANEFSFDGRFEFYVTDPKVVWSNLPLDSWYAVFAYIVDAHGQRIPDGESLGTASRIAELLQVDGHFNLTSPFRNSLRRFPTHLRRDVPIESQLSLSDLAECYTMGLPPLYSAGALVSSIPPVPPIFNPGMSDSGFVLYDSGIDAGELVVQTLVADAQCLQLMGNHAIDNEIETPVNFTCPDQTEADTQISLILNLENRCAPDSLSRNCFVVNPEPSEHFFTGATSCQFLAVSEDLLEMRREELSPQIGERLVMLPEPGQGALAFAGLAAVGALRVFARRSRLG